MRWASGAVSESSIAIDIGTVRVAAVYALEKLGPADRQEQNVSDTILVLW